MIVIVETSTKLWSWILLLIRKGVSFFDYVNHKLICADFSLQIYNRLSVRFHIIICLLVYGNWRRRKTILDHRIFVDEGKVLTIWVYCLSLLFGSVFRQVTVGFCYSCITRFFGNSFLCLFIIGLWVHFHALWWFVQFIRHGLLFWSWRLVLQV